MVPGEKVVPAILLHFLHPGRPRGRPDWSGVTIKFCAMVDGPLV